MFDINITDEEGWTPLLLPAHHGHEDLIRSLLQKDIKIEAKDYTYRRTPLLGAVRDGRGTVVKLLVDKMPTLRPQVMEMVKHHSF
jgi:ankyrin repeat protein